MEFPNIAIQISTVAVHWHLECRIVKCHCVLRRLHDQVPLTQDPQGRYLLFLAALLDAMYNFLWLFFFINTLLSEINWIRFPVIYVLRGRSIYQGRASKLYIRFWETLPKSSLTVRSRLNQFLLSLKNSFLSLPGGLTLNWDVCRHRSTF